MREPLLGLPTVRAGHFVHGRTVRRRRLLDMRRFFLRLLRHLGVQFLCASGIVVLCSEHELRHLWKHLQPDLCLALRAADMAVQRAQRRLLRRWLRRDLVGRFPQCASHVLRALQPARRLDRIHPRQELRKQWRRVFELRRRKHDRLHVPESAPCPVRIEHDNQPGCETHFDRAALSPPIITLFQTTSSHQKLGVVFLWAERDTRAAWMRCVERAGGPTWWGQPIQSVRRPFGRRWFVARWSRRCGRPA